MEYFFCFDKITYLKRKKDISCILCGLRDKDPEIEDTIVYRNESIAVSVNLYPYTSGHLIVYPLRHIEDMRDLTDTEHCSIKETLNRALTILDSLYAPSGYNIGYNMGPASGASIPHLHMHIIPRYPRELGIAELLGGKKVMVEHPLRARERLSEAFLTC